MRSVKPLFRIILECRDRAMPCPFWGVVGAAPYNAECINAFPTKRKSIVTRVIANQCAPWCGNPFSVPPQAALPSLPMLWKTPGFHPLPLVFYFTYVFIYIFFFFFFFILLPRIVNDIESKLLTVHILCHRFRAFPKMALDISKTIAAEGFAPLREAQFL